MDVRRVFKSTANNGQAVLFTFDFLTIGFLD